MTIEPMTVRFTLQLDMIRYLSEAEFGENLAQAREAAADVAAPFGQLILQHADQPPIALYDDLLPLADSLGALLPDLKAGTSTALGSYSQPDVLQFTRDGANVVVVDVDGNERRYPAAALTDAMANCFARLLVVLRGLSPLDPDWQTKLARIAPA